MYLELPVSQLVVAARDAGGRLPFPFTDCRAVDARGAEPDPALDAALAVLLTPRRIVYAVLFDADGGVLGRVAAVEDRRGRCVLLQVSSDRAILGETTVDNTVRAVVDAVGARTDFNAEPLFGREVVLPMSVTRSGGQSAVDGMRAARVPESEVQAWLGAGRLRAGGLLGAVSVGDGTDGVTDGHVERSVSWQCYSAGSVLVVEQSARSRREPDVVFRPLNARTLTRAGVDLLTTLNLQNEARIDPIGWAHKRSGGFAT